MLHHDRFLVSRSSISSTTIARTRHDYIIRHGEVIIFARSWFMRSAALTSIICEVRVNHDDIVVFARSRLV
jgi:hypothetical protein